MKKIFIFFLFFLYSYSVHAQDTISLKNGVIINATIIERNNCKIKYHPIQYANKDTTLSLQLSKINTIHYGNGEVNLLSSQNPRSIYPLGANVGADWFNGLIFLNGGIDYLFTPNISAEINYRSMVPYGYPAFSLLSIGGKYWFANKYSKNGFSPFVGLFFTKWRWRNYEYYLENKPEWSIDYLPEVPIGISYITKFGFQTSIQLNCFLGYRYNTLNIVNGFIEFRVGWRFKTGKKGY